MEFGGLDVGIILDKVFTDGWVVSLLEASKKKPEGLKDGCLKVCGSKLYTPKDLLPKDQKVGYESLASRTGALAVFSALAHFRFVQGYRAWFFCLDWLELDCRMQMLCLVCLFLLVYLEAEQVVGANC